MTLSPNEWKLDPDSDFDSPEWKKTAVEICRHAGVEFRSLERASSSDHVVFLVDDRYLLKMFRPRRNCFGRERKALNFVAGRLPFATPEIVASGELKGLDFIITSQVPGTPLTRAEFLRLPDIEQFTIAVELASGLRKLHELDPAPFLDDWGTFVEERAETFVARQIAHGVNRRVIGKLPQFIADHLPSVPLHPTVFLHGDLHFGNLHFHRVQGRFRVAGIFDFADSRRGFHEYDFLAVGVLMLQGQRELQREFFRAYGYAEHELDEAMRKRLMMQTMLYETSDLRRYAIRLRPEAVDFALEELETAIWCFV